MSNLGYYKTLKFPKNGEKNYKIFFGPLKYQNADEGPDLDPLNYEPF